MGLAMPSIELVTSTLDQIRSEEITSSSEFINVSNTPDDFQPVAHTLVKLLTITPDHECCNLLTCFIDHWVSGAAEKFQKTTLGLPNILANGWNKMC